MTVKNIKREYILTSLSNLNKNGDIDTKKAARIDDFSLKNCFANKYIAGITNKPKRTDHILKNTSPPPKYDQSFKVRKYSGGCAL